MRLCNKLLPIKIRFHQTKINEKHSIVERVKEIRRLSIKSQLLKLRNKITKLKSTVIYNV